MLFCQGAPSYKTLLAIVHLFQTDVFCNLGKGIESKLKFLTFPGDDTKYIKTKCLLRLKCIQMYSMYITIIKQLCLKVNLKSKQVNGA